MSELFGGAARYRALRCLYEHPSRDFGTGELATEAGIDPSNASRWLRRWAELGLVQRQVVRGQSLFRAAEDPSLAPLQQLLQQDGKMAHELRLRLREIDAEVDVATVFGSAARGETQAESDVDLLLLAPRLSKLEAQAHFKKAGRALGRPVNVLLYTPKEWRAMRERRNSLVEDILTQPTLMLKGDLHAA